MDDLNGRIAKEGIMALPRYRIAILNGWTDIKIGSSLKWYGNMPDGERAEVPKWDQCLNLMHELEAELIAHDQAHPTDGYWEEYCEVLMELTGGSIGANIRATAAQKAEAWLTVHEKGGGDG